MNDFPCCEPGHDDRDVLAEIIQDAGEYVPGSHAEFRRTPETVTEYARRHRGTGATYPLNGYPAPDWWGEDQTDYQHVQREVGPWLPVGEVVSASATGGRVDSDPVAHAVNVRIEYDGNQSRAGEWLVAENALTTAQFDAYQRQYRQVVSR